MRTFMKTLLLALLATACAGGSTALAQTQPSPPLQVSGIYPSLSAFSHEGECGIGAVVPWAGRLWWITYPPHLPKGSADKLYSVDASMALTIDPASVGGTHACRMIHAESHQLIIGPYFIDEQGHVRACDVKNKLIGRMTAVARHLTDPANKVYFYDMEGALYEVNVHSLEVTKLFAKPVPGWHGKGAYTAQGRLVISNNGEVPAGPVPKKYDAALPPPSPEDAGVLAEWDGREWRIVERREFTDVTGPGGIHGSPDDKAPLWAIGWDKRSVILKLLDGGKWSTYRMPKGSHSFDPKHGWYTEWPRIREVMNGHYLMVMHGQMFDFPKTFSAANSAGIRPICTHLRYIPDFCVWGDKLVLGADDTTIMLNPLAGQSQTNLWFGKWEDLKSFGPSVGWGGVWLGDAVKANQPSDPFLFAGYDQRVLHLSHRAPHPVTFTVEADREGKGEWQPIAKIEIPANSYRYHIFDSNLHAEWVRVVADSDCLVSAYFQEAVAHEQSAAREAAGTATPSHTGLYAAEGKGLANFAASWIRPPKESHDLDVFTTRFDAAGQASEEHYYQVNEKMEFTVGTPAGESKAMRPKLAVTQDFAVDAASVILTDAKGQHWRLPKTDAIYDEPFGAAGWPRSLREVQSERYIGNWHGIFYEVPRSAGLKDAQNPDYQKMKPIAAHHSRITDYCSWRGMLVLAGADLRQDTGGHYFKAKDGNTGLWFGMVDDLWRLGKPVGHGGPWKNTAVRAGLPSDPYLMTNFDHKRVHLQHDQSSSVKIMLEVDFDNRGTWRTFQTFDVPAGKGLDYEFPAGYMAHWVRATAAQDCVATAEFIYD